MIAIVSLFIVSCADDDSSVVRETKGWDVEKLYNNANEALHKKNYTRSISLYNVLESTYPYGVYAQQGMLDLAYAYYQNDQPELALPTLDQFMATYPTNKNMDYALYLKGFINYKNDNGLMSRFTHQDLSERDPKGLEDAVKAFKELITRYPNSRFTPDAKDKINRLINALSKGELYRARYYMSIKAYLAAISRSQNLIVTYPNTQYVEEALAIQVLAYQKLGQITLADDVKKILKVNFPNSQYLKEDWQYQDMAWYKFWR